MTAAPSKMLNPSLRLGLSIVVVLHLAAVFAPPLAFQTGPSSSVGSMLWPLQGYGEFLYLNRGYAFFAPDPGPSHLIQAAITTETGAVSERMYPDRDQQWPRLLYHRHFMISEFLEEIYEAPGPPAELAEIDPEMAAEWVRRRARYEHVRQSITDHLRHETGQEVAIRRIEHLVPNLGEFRQEPVSLTDERSYRVLLDLPIEFETPVAAPEVIPAPIDGQAEAIPAAADQAIPPAADQAIPAAADQKPSGAQQHEPAAAEGTPSAGEVSPGAAP
jgi:hypothetical protein